MAGVPVDEARYRRALWTEAVPMARMPNPRVLAEVLRSGNLRARLRAAKEGLTGVRLQLIAAALDLGLLDALGEGPASTEQWPGAWMRSTKTC